MTQIFTVQEQEKAKKIVASGLSESIKSLAFFIKSETKIELGSDFFIAKVFTEKYLSKQKGTIYLLTTELVGDIKGVSYLLFSENEVKAIMQAKYPGKKNNETDYFKKQNSLLLEIDNIITAGVMSKFANEFSYRTYGGVPKLEIVEYGKALEIMKFGTAKNEYVLGFKACLIAEKVDVKADFVWSVDNGFVKGIKRWK